MFIKILVFMFITTYVTAEILPYIHVCGRRNPNLDECIVSSVNNLRDKLCEGISEMNVTPLQRLQLSTLVISETDNVKLYMKNSQLSGLCDYVINNFHIDLNKNHFDLQASFKNVLLNSTYDFDIRVLVPIATTGAFSLAAENVNVDIGVDMKIVTKRGKRYMYLSKITVNLNINVFESQFENNDSDQLQKIIENFIGNNQMELLATIKPAFEEAISKTVLSIANNIVKHFTYDELFPDRK